MPVLRVTGMTALLPSLGLRKTEYSLTNPRYGRSEWYDYATKNECLRRENAPLSEECAANISLLHWRGSRSLRISSALSTRTIASSVCAFIARPSTNRVYRSTNTLRFDGISRNHSDSWLVQNESDFQPAHVVLAPRGILTGDGNLSCQVIT